MGLYPVLENRVSGLARFLFQTATSAWGLVFEERHLLLSLRIALVLAQSMHSEEWVVAERAEKRPLQSLEVTRFPGHAATTPFPVAMQRNRVLPVPHEWRIRALQGVSVQRGCLPLQNANGYWGLLQVAHSFFPQAYGRQSPFDRFCIERARLHRSISPRESGISFCSGDKRIASVVSLQSNFRHPTTLKRFEQGLRDRKGRVFETIYSLGNSPSVRIDPFPGGL